MQEIERSSIAYTVTLEDLVAFNLYCFRNSPRIRKIQRRTRFVIPLSVFTALLAMGILMQDIPLWFCLCVSSLGALAALPLLLYDQKHGYIKRIRKIVERKYTQEKHPGALGPHTLEVDRDGITVTNDYQHIRLAWGALTDSDTESGYTYLFIGTMRGFVIRHDAITEGDFKTVLEQIGQYYQHDQKLPQRRGIIAS